MTTSSSPFAQTENDGRYEVLQLVESRPAEPLHDLTIDDEHLPLYFDAEEREASRDTQAEIATPAATPGAGAARARGAADRLADLLTQARARPQLAAGVAAAAAIAVATLVWSQQGRGVLALGSGYLAERLYGAGVKKRIARVLGSKRRR